MTLQQRIERFIGKPAGVESSVADTGDPLLLAHAHQSRAVRQRHAAVTLDTAEAGGNHDRSPRDINTRSAYLIGVIDSLRSDQAPDGPTAPRAWRSALTDCESEPWPPQSGRGSDTPPRGDSE